VCSTPAGIGTTVPGPHSGSWPSTSSIGLPDGADHLVEGMHMGLWA
jgi:hypothetical protein